MFFWKSMESGYLYRVSKKTYCLITSIFFAIFDGSCIKTNATFSNQFLKVCYRMWTHNYIFFFQNNWKISVKKKLKFCFFLYFFSSCHSIKFEKTKYNSESTLFTFKTDLRIWYQFIIYDL